MNAKQLVEQTQAEIAARLHETLRRTGCFEPCDLLAYPGDTAFANLLPKAHFRRVAGEWECSGGSMPSATGLSPEDAYENWLVGAWPSRMSE